MPFWPGHWTTADILDSFKEGFRRRDGPPRTISRLEAACIRFQPSLFGYRRSDVERFRRDAVAALASLESDGLGVTPVESFKRAIFGASPREVGEFRTRVLRTLAPHE